MGDVEVGRLRSGEDTIDLPVGIRGETLPSHVGVFATTGMGKTTGGAGFTGKTTKSPEEQVDALLQLYERCRAVVEK